MKKRYYLLFILLMIFPCIVNATDVNVLLDCPSNAKNGEKITCTIQTNSSIELNSLTANVSTSAGLTYQSHSTNSGWRENSDSSKFYVYGNSVSNMATLGSYTYLVNDDASGDLTVTLSSIETKDSLDTTLSNNGSVTETIKVLSSDATLSNITLNSGTLSPNFSKDVTSYTATVDGNTTSINIDATTSHGGATLTGTGNKTLNYGPNTFKINVKSEAGTTKTYTINVTRVDNRSTDNTLSKLSLSAGTLSPTFNKDVTSYKATVKSGVSSVIVSATLNDTKSSFIGEYKPRTINLKYGENLVEIKVKSEKGTEKIYKIVITREDTRSSDNTLASLSLSKGELSPKYSKTTTNYTVKVEKDVEYIDINATLNNKKASFIDGYGPRSIKLNMGENKVQIKVKSEKNTERIYTISIIRDDGKSYNNNLKTLTIDDKPITIEENKTEYHLSIDYTDTMFNIKAETSDSKSSFKITKPEKLVVGENIVKILVTAENKSTKEYIIKINMLAKNEELDIKPILKNIIVSGYELNFNEETDTYYLKINEENTLNITIEKYDDTTNYEITGNENLKNGSIIEIKVTTTDEQEKIYKINIEKEEKAKFEFNYYWIVGILGVILVILIIIIIIDKKKNNNNKTPKVKTKKIKNTKIKSSNDILSKVERQLNSINNKQEKITTDNEPIVENEQISKIPVINSTIVETPKVEIKTANDIKKSTIIKPEVEEQKEEISEEEKVENTPTKICAICGHRVAANATVCPYCKRKW